MFRAETRCFAGKLQKRRNSAQSRNSVSRQQVEKRRDLCSEQKLGVSPASCKKGGILLREQKLGVSPAS